MSALVNGSRIHYQDVGEGLPVLLVHGFPLDHTIWRAQARTLAAHYRFILPDLRGFGGSETPVGLYTMEQHADDLASLLDHLQIEQVVLGGLSMGGYVAFAFYRKYARRVRALILSDTRAAADSPEGRARRQTSASQVEIEGTATLVEGMLPRMVSQQTLETKPQVMKRLQKIMLGVSQQGAASAQRGMAARLDATALLTAITVPALVLVGDNDRLTTPEEMSGLARAILQARFVIIPGAGHLPPMENPRAFNRALREFLAVL
jgi:3-oxoadipate enol-lactonase